MTTTDVKDLRRVLESVPEREPLAMSHLDAGIDHSVQYLGSDAALRSLEADTYWPKWDSPWWHMLLLHELGETHRIPRRAIEKMVEGLNALPIHIFPIHPEDSPPGADPARDSSCHCALGCIHQVLTAAGVDVDHELPWIEPWFVRYQMADGGLNCDASAYLVEGECPSSMVGTIAPFEAMLQGGAASWTAEQAVFLRRGADFLIDRRLMLGSRSVHNGVERDREPSWRQPCFPRFYYYDVGRGASALVRWATAAGTTLPIVAVSGVVDHLVAAFPDGIVRLGRRAYEGLGTWIRDGSGAWVRQAQAGTFPLLEAASAPGQVCPTSTRQWAATRRMLIDLIDGDRITVTGSARSAP